METIKSLFLESALPCWVIFGLLVAATVESLIARGWIANLTPFAIHEILVIWDGYRRE